MVAEGFQILVISFYRSRACFAPLLREKGETSLAPTSHSPHNICSDKTTKQQQTKNNRLHKHQRYLSTTNSTPAMIKYKLLFFLVGALSNSILQVTATDPVCYFQFTFPEPMIEADCAFAAMAAGLTGEDVVPCVRRQLRGDNDDQQRELQLYSSKCMTECPKAGIELFSANWRNCVHVCPRYCARRRELAVEGADDKLSYGSSSSNNLELVPRELSGCGNLSPIVASMNSALSNAFTNNKEEKDAAKAILDSASVECFCQYP